MNNYLLTFDDFTKNKICVILISRKRKMKKEIVFIGDEFYFKSQSHMSSIYQKLPNGNFLRYDWGYAACDLREGISLDMRPATKNEKAFFQKMLKGAKV